MHPPLDRWEPLTPAGAADVMEEFAGPWWVAGGWAIELYVGRRLRPHADLDVLVLREDHQRLPDVLDGWELWAADPPGALRPWSPGEALPDHVHDVWCTRVGSHAWQLQFMVDESYEGEWVSRRHARVRAPIASIGHRTRAGVPFLDPAIQLFYKAKGRRAKDEADFAAALPRLSIAQRAWLNDALGQTLPEHPWREALMHVIKITDAPG